MFNKFKWLTLILAMLCAFTLVGCKDDKTDGGDDNTDTTVPVISQTEITIKLDEEVVLEVTDFDGEVSWEVSDVKVITVDDGKVTGVGLGSAIVYATAGDYTLTCKVTCVVDYIEVPKLILDGEVLTNGSYNITLAVGGEYTLTPALVKDGKTLSGVTYTLSSTNSAVTIDGNTIKGASLTDGAVVTVSCNYDGELYTLNLTVKVK